MTTPSEKSTSAPIFEDPLEDLLDDFVQATEEFKQGILDLKKLDEAKRIMVENFIHEGRKVFDGFLTTLKPSEDSAES